MSGKEHKKLTNPAPFISWWMTSKMQQGLLFFYRHNSSTNNSIVWRVCLPSSVVSCPPPAWPQPVTTPQAHRKFSNSCPLPTAAVNFYAHAKIPVLEAAPGNTLSNLVDTTAYLPNFDNDRRVLFHSPFTCPFSSQLKLKWEEGSTGFPDAVRSPALPTHCGAWVFSLLCNGQHDTSTTGGKGSYRETWASSNSVVCLSRLVWVHRCRFLSAARAGSDILLHHTEQPNREKRGKSLWKEEQQNLHIFPQALPCCASCFPVLSLLTPCLA